MEKQTGKNGQDADDPSAAVVSIFKYHGFETILGMICVDYVLGKK